MMGKAVHSYTPEPRKYEPEHCCETAAKVLADGESLAAVCCELDICRETLRTWRDTYPEFARAVKKGLAHAQRDWEKLGRDGINGDIKNFGASPWIFTMKNRFRDDYAEEKDNKSASDSLVEKLLEKLADSE